MIAIIDYKAGNLTSVQLAFAYLGVKAEITDQPEKILAAGRVVFPGVGSAGAARRSIMALRLENVLKEIAARGTPFLGICLGTQIIFDSSEEDGGTEGLALLSGKVRRFMPADRADKVPQIGWNSVTIIKKHPVLEGIEDQSEFYFVHSYYPEPRNKAEIIGATDYAGITFASIVGRNNLVATQFHPEKSGRIGLKLLENFSRWSP
ncbi:MAG: imidazole glycerol phosphate synthase subunit HisH [Kiritimatiellae bacterium]|nr:imidazole glycerol phosphate synthase subunit HisH [Kiritimatiellia bacterium]